MSEKKEKTKHLSIRINTLVFDRLEAFAEATKRSRSSVIDRAVEEYLDRRDGTAKPPTKAAR